MRYIIVSQKEWNKGLIDNLSKLFPSDSWMLLSDKDEFNLNTLEKISPDKIFIPHWSYIIPKEIYESYECIVFHMTDLPFGRVGSPLQNLIERGFNESVISALRVVKDLDAGDMYMKEGISLEGSAREIYERANLMI